MGYFLVVFPRSPDCQKMKMLGLFPVYGLKQTCLLNRIFLAVSWSSGAQISFTACG